MKKLTFLFFLFSALTLFSQNQHRLNININVPDTRISDVKGSGRLMVIVSKTRNPGPAYQRNFSDGRIGFAVNTVKNQFASPFNLNSRDDVFSTRDISLNSFPEGTWFVQAVLNLSDEPEMIAGGNLVSIAVKVTLTKDTPIILSLSDLIKGRNQPQPKDTTFVKFIEIKSKILSDWWGKPMNLKASVLLPSKFYKNQGEKFPLRVNIGGYGSKCTRVIRMTDRNPEFSKWWFSEEAPQIINLFLDGDGPYGDPYYVDSENNGPYGKALTEELIPYIEKRFNAIGTPESRFLDGCSTGGWVSFALQVFYPDYFNGAWSFSADPVDFNNMQLVNIYKDKNFYYNSFGYETPSMRNKSGQPLLSIKDEVAGENLISFTNSYTTSHGQWGAWNAVYGPKGKDRLPVPLWNTVTGVIDSTVAVQWNKYDLLNYLKTNWQVVGPKLQHKIWIWMGDMDNFYLNNAMRQMDAFLKSTSNPKSDAKVTFEPMNGHCEGYDAKWVLEMMQEKIDTGKIQKN